MMKRLSMQHDSTKDEQNDTDDDDLFRQEMHDVIPLNADEKIQHRPERKPIRPNAATDVITIDDVFSDAHVEDCPDELRFSRSGVQPSTLKKLRQGKMPVDHTIDLHGLTVDKARNYLLEFLGECQNDGSRCVIIVHGKGYSSEGAKPVIKPLVNRWLREIPLVLAFASAKPADGGTGAVYVLLKKQD